MSSSKVLKLCAVVLTAVMVTPISPMANAAKTPKLKATAGREDAETNTILNGRGAPKPTLGVDGDFYIDVLSFTIYGPKKNNKWPTGVSLKGPQGDAGKIGERGAAGNSGVATKGDKGDKGERGEKGDKGDKGERGEAGATGASGPAGPQGAAGAQGATGPSGANGAAGVAGSTGPQGAQGLKGDKGDTGDTGLQGATGLKGDKGDTGTSGISLATYGSISFSSTLVGAKDQVTESQTFGDFKARTCYVVDLLVYGSGATDTASLALKFAVVADGAAPTISGVQWLNSSGNTYRTGQLQVEHKVWARFLIDGKDVLSGYGIRVQLTNGESVMAGRNITFSGTFRSQVVDSITAVSP